MEKNIWLDFGNEEYIEINWKNALGSLYNYLNYISLSLPEEIESLIETPKQLYDLVCSTTTELIFINKDNYLFNPIFFGLYFKLDEEFTKRMRDK